MFFNIKTIFFWIKFNLNNLVEIVIQQPKLFINWGEWRNYEKGIVINSMDGIYCVS